MKLLPYILSSCTLFAPLASPAETAGRILGEPLALTEATAIAKILEAPTEFDGRRVQVRGQVTSVCAAKGCWMMISDGLGHEIRVKVVDDGPIVFPQDAPGGPATVEGTVRRIEMTREQYIRWQSHLAEENGGKFDASRVGAGPFERVELAGLGARLDGR